MGWPLDIVIYSPGLPHDGATLGQRSLGGSETAAICVADHLARRGHHVTVFSRCEGGLFGGVEYRPIEQYAAYVCSAPHDVTIVSREITALAGRMQSKIKILWCHDLALKRRRNTLASVLWQITNVYLLSDFMRRQYIEANEGIPEEIYRVTRNGIRTQAFAGLSDLTRDRTKLVYASRPERGLENILAIMEILHRRGSPLQLAVCGYDNTPPQLQAYYEGLWARARQLPNVRLLGCLKQEDFYRELATSLAWVYPGVSGEFREISCIAAVEAMASGTPAIAIKRGALPETLGEGTAIWVGDESGDPHDPKHREAFADALIKLTHDPGGWDAMSRRGRQRAATLDWAGVAEQWETWWDEDLAKRVTSRDRVEKHLRRIGDHELLAWYQSQAQETM